MGEMFKDIPVSVKENGITEAPAPYKILEEPSRHGRPLKIITIGAGAAAINLAHEVSISPLKLELVCYEKNPEIGGTWYENRYPGCACDIPSVNYQYSWAPSIHWSSYYSSSTEILQYFKNIVKDHDLQKYMRLSHRVVGAWWIEEDQQWKVKVQKGDNPEDVIEDRCNILINASGVLNKWKWPAIEGRETFQGPMLHSANWDPTISLKDKTVAIIGCGSSAVQIVPAILPEVKHMKNFIRSQIWVTDGFGSKFAGKNGGNFKYTEAQKKILSEDPKLYLRYRKNIESELNSRFRFIINDSEEQKSAMKYAEGEMRRKLAKKPELGDIIIPKNFGVGCRRPTPGQGYLEGLCDDKVDVITSEIAEITPKGIKTQDGTEHEVDIIICATGFDVSWVPSYPTIGRDNRSLSEEWKNGPSTYLSLSVPHFPNYLIYNGPFGPYAHGSILPVMETLTTYFLQLFTKMSQELLTSISPSPAAVADFALHRRTFLPRTAWSQPCRSWFKHPGGELLMWPGSRIQFFETIKQVRWEDYDVKYEGGNRFAWLGNGFAEREVDGRDLSWYLGSLDGSDKQPDYNLDDIREFLDCE